MSDNRRMPPQNIEAEMSVLGGILLVHREEYYDRENIDFKGKAEIIISKQRNGPVDTVIWPF